MGLRILTYHSISNIGVTVDNFRCQMEYLKKNYNVIPLGRADSVFNEEMDRQPVAITFDDGYEDNFTEAFPIMSELDLPFAIFLVTGYLGKVPSEKANLYPGLKLLSKKEVNSMANSGLVSFFRHSHRHIDFSKSTTSELINDLQANKAFLQDLCGEAYLPDFIAYPFGKDPKEENLKIVKKEGIRFGLVVDNNLVNRDSLTDKPMKISRIHVDTEDYKVRFYWKLRSKYRNASLLSKKLRDYSLPREFS